MKYGEAGPLAPTYAIGRTLMGARAKLLGYDIAVKGGENMVADQAVLYGPSHRNKEDPWLLGLVIPRPVFFMAKKELWTAEYAYLGYLASLVGAFPVDRENPGHSTIREARKHLIKGRAVGIAGEGSRYEDKEKKIVRGPQIGDLYRSIGLLAVLENVPIVAVGIGLVRRLSGRRREKIARIVIPPAIYPSVNLPKHESVTKIMDEFRDSLQAAFTEASEAAATEVTVTVEE